jgi:hypothetical protein
LLQRANKTENGDPTRGMIVKLLNNIESVNEMLEKYQKQHLDLMSLFLMGSGMR